ncbi:MAG: prepilin peptidase [Candidatus Peribacter sp.]|jgi:leader peptidase (prepilin peptidase) / N-methyltransferase|nr:prepilin peptidase [Candidatus Peribacter sp.]MBT4393074.1 prepilin peptidase [Candidatus Peribacter sp.]MBT4600872.1 prepilin peptidase [Candidatus Peribacter sp.]MBT5148997.1 prepilin peptidase [Candidatus Peribacter sp.]MBT5638323.1 prepilin peptidase [Candidatus Peribacter sp.]
MTFTIWLFGIAGLCFGSFGSVLAERIPQGMSIGGRSQCSACKRTLHPLELIPLLSFCCLRGRCRSCKDCIGFRYPFLEIISAALFIAALFYRPVLPQAIVLSLILWLMLIISVIDIRTQTISDLLNIPLLALAVGYSIMLGQFEIDGIVLGVAFFGAQWAVSRGKCLGSGDIILAAGIGALMGSWERMAVCLFLTYVLGGAIASALLISGKVKRGQYVAFAPFLVLGAIVSIFAHSRIDQFIDLYFGI